MSHEKSKRMLRIISLALVVSISGSGCAMLPKIEFSMPTMPKLWGKKDKAEDAQTVYQEDIVQPEEEPIYQEPIRTPSRAETGPATISPYAEDAPSQQGTMAQQPSRVPMQQPAQQPMTSSAEPLSAEDIAMMSRNRRAVARQATRTIGDIEAVLAGAMRIYTPRGMAPYPVAILFHDCEGATVSQERDWANFYTSQGMAMIAVDSISPRDLAWEDVCAQDALNPAERAADVFAAVSFARDLEIIDPDKIVLSGFGHGGSTVWASLLLASGQTPPIGVRTYPRDGLAGVKGAYLFYTPCLAPWTVNVTAIDFLGASDKFVDEQTCVKHARRISGSEVSFDYEIFPGATHSFDHRSPSPANREAGAVYDAKAIGTAMEMIKDHLAKNVK